MQRIPNTKAKMANEGDFLILLNMHKVIVVQIYIR
jgi:hypothetical protein